MWKFSSSIAKVAAGSIILCMSGCKVSWNLECLILYKSGIQTMCTAVVVDSRLVLQSLLESVLVAKGNCA